LSKTSQNGRVAQGGKEKSPLTGRDSAKPPVLQSQPVKGYFQKGTDLIWAL
jgi:hypothetical protein